ncbi:hypothetical protein K470DRAFT_296993 [Piedraia hortae CBS 480.64]|uniref:Nephrocystin 3-like N-terminal domain-containing protein n=1 Tax=Piedraia hortae CBS 480.64 TaxID=1314780 RepID=A0A6A7BQT9_9PEZI|nr:hypothetical protein K470DRAFT_296993 [Piedraia hortae CBS 480.64]
MPGCWESFKAICESLVSKLRPHKSKKSKHATPGAPAPASQHLQTLRPNNTPVEVSRPDPQPSQPSQSQSAPLEASASTSQTSQPSQPNNALAEASASVPQTSQSNNVPVDASPPAPQPSQPNNMPAEVLASCPRHLQPPHPRNASVEVPSPQSLNAPVQTSVSASQPLQPSQPNSQQKLREDALVGISPDKREFVEKHVDLDSNLERDATNVRALRDRNQESRTQKWKDKMGTISSQIMNFAPVFDAATNAQAEVLSLPWAGIRVLLMVAEEAHKQSESILEGFETVLDTNNLLSAYLSIYSQVNGTPTIEFPYNSIVKLYGFILEFVVQSQIIREGKPWKQVIQSLTGGVIPEFKTGHDRMLNAVERHTRAVDREVSKEQRDQVEEQLKALRKAQGEVNNRVKGVQQMLDLSALQAVAGAAYDSTNGESQLCLKDTRVQIRKEILHCATTSDDQRLFWLSGKTGTGKSTIARTVADELARQGYLVGSFFFKRGQDKLGRARSLFPTIARQMAYSIPSISDKIADASHGSPLLMQLQSPWKSRYQTESATDVWAIVIDALDECDAKETIGQAMKLWPKLRSHTSMNLRVFVTSRSDNEIWSALDQLDPKHFREVSNNPGKRLREWVDRLNFTETDTLTLIYSDILEQAADFDKEWLQWFCQVIKPFALLHSSLTIPALADLLGGDTTMIGNALTPLSSVIDFPSGKEVKTGSRATVRIYHESFRDFLIDPSHKSRPQFWVNEGETHGILLTRCLDLPKNKLDRDVCKQKDPATERKGISTEVVEKHTPESLQYACRYWTSHAVKSNRTLEGGGQVDCFLRASFLHWTEAMAWLDKLGEMVLCLKKLQEAINQVETYLSALAFASSNSIVRNTFWHEVEDFLQVWPPVATDWGFELQTLKGHAGRILSITPSSDGSRLVTVGRDKTVRLWDVESDTEEKRTEIEMPYHYIREVASAFPKEDLVIIAGVRAGYWMWNLEDDARRIDLKLPRHAKSVSVSPNSRYAAWGLRNGKIYIWDADEDAGQVLRGHNFPVRCLYFSSNSETLLSGSKDIWKWSAQAGHERICQVGTVIRAIAISPNGKFVVFCSDTVSVFHCTTHEVDQIMPKDIFLPSFPLLVTPDSQKVFGFWRGWTLSLRLLNATRADEAATGSRRHSHDIIARREDNLGWLNVDLALKSPQHRTGYAKVALSTNGRSLASLAQGNQLNVWNIETRTCEHRLTDDRLCKSPRLLQQRLVLISSDSHFVVVASLYNPADNAVLIWDLEADELRELKDIPSEVTVLELSPDNKTLLCGLRDGRILAIDLERGVLRGKYTGHTKRIWDIAISPDGQNFASASFDDTIRIWGPKSQTPLVLRSEETFETCFSADGRMLYTRNSKNRICEWDIEKTCIVRTLAEGPYGGSIPIDGHFVSSTFMPVMDRLAANEAAQSQTQAESFASTRSTLMFQGRRICALDKRRYPEQWITVDGRKMFKRPYQLKASDGFSCGRTMVFPNDETGFAVLYFTGKDSF